MAVEPFFSFVGNFDKSVDPSVNENQLNANLQHDAALCIFDKYQTT